MDPSAPTLLQPRDELLPGIVFDFGGGQQYTLPPLTLGALQRLQQPLMQLQAAEALAPASLATIAQAVHSSLRRNYPAVTLEQVGELVDVGNMLELVAAVLDVSGIKRKAAAGPNPPAQPAPAETPAPTGPA